MLEEKISNAIKRGILTIGALGIIAGCDGGICAAPAQTYVHKSEINYSIDRNAIIGESAEYYVLASCRDECTYQPDSDCCWCPD